MIPLIAHFSNLFVLSILFIIDSAAVVAEYIKDGVLSGMSLRMNQCMWKELSVLQFGYFVHKF